MSKKRYKEILESLPLYHDEAREYKENLDTMPSYYNYFTPSHEMALEYPGLKLESDTTQDLLNQLIDLKDQRNGVLMEMDLLKDVLKENNVKISHFNKKLHKHRISEKRHLKRELKGEKRFFLSNGKTIKSLVELKDKVNSMKRADFNQHIENNDFGNWVKHCFRNKSLAKKVNSAKTKKQLIDVLENNLR
jgi:hypothetical protein